MEKLEPKFIKLHAKIITPIHIDNGEVLDRMDYFYFDSFDEIQILDRKWLIECAKKDKNLFANIIKSIGSGKFKQLEEFKSDFYSKYAENFINENGVKEEIKIGKKAENYLLQLGNKNNNGEIKGFSRFGLDKELFIPGSTLKGIFRTISLLNKISEVNNYIREKKENYLKTLDFGDDFKNTFSFLSFEDININNLNKNLEIQEICSKNKPPRVGQPPKEGINQVLEVLTNGEFEININDLNSKISNEKLSLMLKKYSNTLISREERILNNIGFRSDFIQKLKEELVNGYFPIKIGMFKKSLSYKLFWEEMIQELNMNFEGKNWLTESKKKGIGDKLLYLDEQEEPIGWIAIKILDN